uniref:Uncharacterized protein n=1 Tax=Aegilops tauschii subsp. strangulata TaxID=200361 RepID=A0A453HE77_AEGTS
MASRFVDFQYPSSVVGFALPEPGSSRPCSGVVKTHAFRQLPPCSNYCSLQGFTCVRHHLLEV